MTLPAKFPISIDEDWRKNLARTLPPVTPKPTFNAADVLRTLRNLGRTPQTESLIKKLMPEAGEQHMTAIFGPPTPLAPTSGQQWFPPNQPKIETGITPKPLTPAQQEQFNPSPQGKGVTEPIGARPNPVSNVMLNTPAGKAIQTVAGVAAIGITGWQGIQAAYNTLMPLVVQNRLQNWAQTHLVQGEQLDAATIKNFSNWATQNLSKRFLVPNMASRFFSQGAKGVSFAQEGEQAAANAADEMVNAFGATLIPRGTQTGAMAFGGLPKNPPGFPGGTGTESVTGMAGAAAARTLTGGTKEPWQMTKAEFEGQPDVVYHGGRSEYKIDVSAKPSASTGNPTARLGAFFTPSKQEALRYVSDFHGGKGVVQTAKLNMNKPYRMPFSEFDKLVEVEWKKLSFPEGIAELEGKVDTLKAKLATEGYDGIIVGESGKARPQEVIAFENKAIVQHRYSVEQAIREGKPVSPEVLKDYPDLAQQVNPPAGATSQAADAAQGMTEFLSTDPIATYRVKMGNRNVGLESFISLREQSFPEYFTVKQAEALNPTQDFSRFKVQGTPRYNHVPKDAALDDLATRFNMTADEIGDRVMAIRKSRQEAVDMAKIENDPTTNLLRGKMAEELGLRPQIAEQAQKAIAELPPVASPSVSGGTTADWLKGTAASERVSFDRVTKRVDPIPVGSEKSPKVLYKGMQGAPETLQQGTGGAAGPGIYLAEKRSKAVAFAGAEGQVNEFYTNVKNPLLITADQRLDAPALNKWARDNGFDSLYIPSEGEWVIFNSENVRYTKSLSGAIPETGGAKIPPPPELPPVKPPGGSPPVDVTQPSPAIPVGPQAETVLGLTPIEPGLVRGEVMGNWAKNLVNKAYGKATGSEVMVKADPVANAAMRQRLDWRIAAESKANIIGTEAATAVDKAFYFDKNGGIARLAGIDPNVPGPPTLQDLAARYPVYEPHLTDTEKQVLLKLKVDIEPYRGLLEEVGVTDIGHRPDVMKGGFYLPRGNAALEGADEPLKVGGGRRGSRKGFEKSAEFSSMAEGIEKGYEYSPIGQTLTGYANAAGQRAIDAHVGNYFKSVTDETGQLFGETPKMRLMRQNPEVAKVYQEINGNIDKLKANIGALTERQLAVIELWQNDPEWGDIDTLLEGLATMRGGTPAMTRPALKTLLEQNIEALQAFRPEYKAAMKKAMATPRDQGVIIMPALNGWTFPNEIANAANQILKKEGPTTGTLSTAVNTVNAMNNLYRGIRATLDNSALGIQGLLGMYGEPRAYAKALETNIRAWGPNGDKILGSFLKKFDETAAPAGRLTSEAWARAGLHVGGATGEFAIGGKGLGQVISGLPGIRQANRAFGFFGDALRVQWADYQLGSLLKHRTLEEITASGDLGRIASAANVMTGYAKGKTFGSVGDLVLFAPRWMQSRLETVAKAGMGLRPGASLDQKMARDSLLKLIGIGVGLTVAANLALGNKTDYRPILDGKRNSQFMKIKYKGHYYSLFGPWDSLLATFLHVGTGKPLQALRSSGSALTSGAFDIITGRDFNYKPTTDTPAHFAQWVMSQFVPFSAGSLPGSIQQIAGGDVAGGAINSAAQVLGVKNYPVPETEALRSVPDYFKLLGQRDVDGLASMLKANDGASADKIATINAKDWTYDVVSLRRDVGNAITNLKPDAVAALPPLAGYLRTQQGLRDTYSLMSAEEQVQYKENNPDYLVGQLFWGYNTDIPSMDIATRLETIANQYNIPLELIPAFQKTDSGKERMPPRPLWSDFFAYYDLRTKDGAADMTARNAFRRSHPALEKWGEANLGWKPLSSGTSSGSTSARTTTPSRPLLPVR